MSWMYSTSAAWRWYAVAARWPGVKCATLIFCNAISTLLIWNRNHYALVCVFRYLKHDLFPQLRSCIRPGGRIVYETYNINYLNHVPQFNADFLLKPGELAGYFYNWKVLYDTQADHISRFVAIKPNGN